MPIDFKQAASNMIDSGATDEDVRIVLDNMKNYASSLIDEGKSNDEITKTIQATKWNDKLIFAPSAQAQATGRGVLSQIGEAALGRPLRTTGRELATGFQELTSGEAPLTGIARMVGAPIRGFVGEPVEELTKPVLGETGGRLAGETASGLVGIPTAAAAPAAIGALRNVSSRIATAATAGGKKLQITGAQRTANIETALGRPGIAKRVIEDPKAIKQAFDAADAVPNKVPTKALSDTLDNIVTRGPLDDEAQRVINYYRTSDVVGGSPDANYKDLINAAQNIGDSISPRLSNASNAALRDARKAIVDATNAVHPAFAEANRLTAQLKSTEEILRAYNPGNPSSSLRVIDNLMSKKPWITESIGLDTPEKIEKFRGVIQSGVKAQVLATFLKSAGVVAAAGVIGGVVGGSIVGRR